ncbi:TPA: hypothetical protein ACTYW0_004098 [Enterobacter asburiae]
MNDIPDAERSAISTLVSLLKQVPVIDKVDSQERLGRNGREKGIDGILDVSSGKKTYELICEFKSNGQPKNVRAAIHQLKAYMYDRGGDAIPVVLAPYLSPESRQLCADQNVAFLDQQGNAYFRFGGIYISHQAPGIPAAEKRDLRSVFSPKSAQVLRMMLNERQRAWRVTELAEKGNISLGHASNVRKKLLAREWAVSNDDGLILSKPGALLDEWKKGYRPLAGKRIKFYTPLHGKLLEESLRGLLGCDDEIGYAVLASFSAAQWLSPYGRTGMHYFYADEKGLSRLIDGLSLTTTAKGENVIVTIPSDRGIFLDVIEPAQGIYTTGAVQTYLDLSSQGERGQESADHLRNEWMDW